MQKLFFCAIIETEQSKTGQETRFSFVKREKKDILKKKYSYKRNMELAKPIPVAEEPDASQQFAEEKAGDLQLVPIEEPLGKVDIDISAANETPFEVAGETRSGETTAHVTESGGWQMLKEASRDVLRGAYEKIKSTEPVQNALDRFQVWKSGIIAKHLEGRLKNAEAGRQRVLETASAYGKSADDTEASITALTARMAEHGIILSPEALEKAQQELKEARQKKAIHMGKAEEQEMKVMTLRGKHETYKQTLENATERINSKLTAKQESNNLELQQIREAQEKLIAEQKMIAELIKKLDADYDAVVGELVRASGEKKKLLQEAVWKLGTDRDRKQRSLDGLTQVVNRNVSDMAVLEKKNGDLESKKIQKESDEAPVSATEPIRSNPQRVRTQQFFNGSQ